MSDWEMVGDGEDFDEYDDCYDRTGEDLLADYMDWDYDWTRDIDLSQEFGHSYLHEDQEDEWN